MEFLHRRYGRVADWQGSWCREECRDLARRYRAESRRLARFRPAGEGADPSAGPRR
jgi:hypothetical protein